MPNSLKISALFFVGIACLSTTAWSQVISELPNPHAATCSDFKHHKAANSWSPKGEIQITSTSGTVSMGPDRSFSAGQVFGGYDLGKWLDDNCKKSKVW
jgi:hypothetical protein